MAIRSSHKRFTVDDVSELDDVALIAGLEEGDECIVKTGGPLYYTRSGSDWVLKADTISYANLAAFPVTGKTNKTYIAEDSNNTYRWDGAAYVSIGAGGGGLSLGETNTTAYRGDRGKTAFDHSQSTHAPTDAQKNSDITKAEIEAKLTGAITSHSHASETDNNYTNTDKSKVDFISVSQPVNLDDIESRVNELDASVILKGTWDASVGTFPGSDLAQAGWSYIVSVGGTVDGVEFVINDRIIAITDNASSAIFVANWFKADYTDAVISVNGLTGAVTLTTANVSDSSNKRYVTDAQLTILGNTSGTNSGDNAVNTLYSGLAASKQDTLVSATNIKTINGSSVLGSGNLTVSASATGILLDKQFSLMQSDGTLNAASGVQTWCGTNKTGQDVFTVAANTTYLVEGYWYVNTGSTTHTTAMAWALATATVTDFQYRVLLWSAAANTLTTTQSTVHVSGVASKVLNATSAAVYTIIQFSGIIVIGTGGTITPQINFSANPTGTNLMKRGSWTSFTRLGDNTTASAGGWG